MLIGALVGRGRSGGFGGVWAVVGIGVVLSRAGNFPAVDVVMYGDDEDVRTVGLTSRSSSATVVCSVVGAVLLLLVDGG